MSDELNLEPEAAAGGVDSWETPLIAGLTTAAAPAPVAPTDPSPATAAIVAGYVEQSTAADSALAAIAAKVPHYGGTAQAGIATIVTTDTQSTTSLRPDPTTP
jgi:hypothetical protein